MATNPRVLIVEDEPGIRRLLSLVLAADYDVDAVEDGERALDQIASTDYAAAVVDVKLPGIDGYSVCRAIRARPGGDRVKIVLCSGWIESPAAGRERGCEADAFLAKPVSPTALRTELQRLLAAG
jgi:CheY-like chemotaxis protein